MQRQGEPASHHRVGVTNVSTTASRVALFHGMALLTGFASRARRASLSWRVKPLAPYTVRLLCSCVRTSSSRSVMPAGRRASTRMSSIIRQSSCHTTTAGGCRPRKTLERASRCSAYRNMELRKRSRSSTENNKSHTASTCTALGSVLITDETKASNSHHNTARAAAPCHSPLVCSTRGGASRLNGARLRYVREGGESPPAARRRGAAGSIAYISEER